MVEVRLFLGENEIILNCFIWVGFVLVGKKKIDIYKSVIFVVKYCGF